VNAIFFTVIVLIILNMQEKMTVLLKADLYENTGSKCPTPKA